MVVTLSSFSTRKQLKHAYVLHLSIRRILLVRLPPKTPILNPADLQPLHGPQWKGALTYLDYTSNKKVSIPSNLTVTSSTEDNRS